METMTRLKHRRRRGTALLLIAIAGALCMQGLTAPQRMPLSETTHLEPRSVWEMFGGAAATNGERELRELEELMEDEVAMRRFLLSPLGQVEAGEEDYDAAAAAAFEEAVNFDDNHVDDYPQLQSYTLEDTLDESNMFEYTFCLMVYNPAEDEFVGLYNKDHKWKNGNKKLWKTMRYLAYMLRRTFPERFTRDSPEWVVAIGSGDYPHVRRNRLPHDGMAPVLMFGSSFSDTAMYSNMMAMPMPEAHHLFCFQEFMDHGRTCKEMVANKPEVEGDEGQLVFGEEYGLEWDELTPQLVWRGTDFGFLPTLQSRPSLVHPDSRLFIRTDPGKGNKRVDAIHAMMEKFDTLLPRWKGVALSADAELQGQQEKRLPWADIKFSAYLDAGKSATVGSPKYAAWESVGIGVDSGKSLTDLAKYKYHIDLGGGGGTTWSGTIEKLAMPGLLFHHVTPAKDYIHDRMQPWKHYVPVASDLKDLRSKFDWAEAHPAEAKRIADAGTEFMRMLGTPEGFGKMFREDFVEPMRRVIEAYRPVASTHPDAKSWQDVLHSNKDCRVIPVMKCSGIALEGSCKLTGGDEVLQWQKRGGLYQVLE